MNFEEYLNEALISADTLDWSGIEKAAALIKKPKLETSDVEDLMLGFIKDVGDMEKMMKNKDVTKQLADIFKKLKKQLPAEMTKV